MYNDTTLKCIRDAAKDLAARSQIDKDGLEYGVDVDIFVAKVMTYLGYAREPARTAKEILARKEVWHRADD